MSRLKLYWPNSRRQLEAVVMAPVSADRAGEPAVIPFARCRRRPGDGSRLTDVVDRAYTIYTNGRCPVCRHPVVEPIELNDAVVGRGNLPVPGTATLVGFHCEGCDSEWPA